MYVSPKKYEMITFNVGDGCLKAIDHSFVVFIIHDIDADQIKDYFHLIFTFNKVTDAKGIPAKYAFLISFRKKKLV